METDPLASFKTCDYCNDSNCASLVHMRSVQAALRRAQLFIVLVALSSVAEETTFCKFNSLCRCQGIFHRHKVKFVVVRYGEDHFPRSPFSRVKLWFSVPVKTVCK